MEKGIPRKKKKEKQKSGGDAHHHQGEAAKDKEGLDHAPNTKELLDLKQTRQLYKSNLYRLQLEELLANVGVKAARLKEFGPLLIAINETLNRLTGRDIPADFASEFPSLVFHFILPAAFTFTRPARVDVVGSYVLKAVTKPVTNIDIAMEMPKDMFLERDHINYRYFDKRAAYLGEVHRQLTDICTSIDTPQQQQPERQKKKKRKTGGSNSEATTPAPPAPAPTPTSPLAPFRPSLAFHAWHGDPRKPIIIMTVTPPQDHPSARRFHNWRVRLFPVVSDDTFREARLAPSWNSVRQPTTTSSMLALEEYRRSVQKGGGERVGKSRAQEVEREGLALPPTPAYNAAVLEDMRMRRHVHLLVECLEKWPALKDTLHLIKTWAFQRGFLATPKCPHFTSVDGFTLSLVAAHCTRAHSGAASTAAPQLFKLTMAFLARPQLLTHKWVFGRGGGAARGDKDPPQGQGALYDSDEETFNVLWRCGLHMQELHDEARRTLSLLESASDPFTALFGIRYRPEFSWDLHIHVPHDAIPPPNKLPQAGLFDDHGGKATEWEQLPHVAFAATLVALLRRGLTDRVHGYAIRFVPPASSGSESDDGKYCWHGEEVPPRCCGVAVGLMLDREHMNRAIDKGPSADTAEAKRFKAFWGGKSEIRRFRDSSILECVVWQPPATDCIFPEGHPTHPSVPTQIIRHLLKTYFPSLHATNDVQMTSSAKSNKRKGIEEEGALATARESERCVIHTAPLTMSPSVSDDGTGLWSAFNEFKSHLDELTTLPLAIKEVKPVSPSFRYCAVGSEPRAAGVSNTRLLRELRGGAAAHTDEEEDGGHRRVHDVVIEFEGSGAWPTDEAAIRKIKTAFLIKLQSDMSSEFGIESDLTAAYADVKYPDHIFRVRIFHPKEVGGIAAQVTNPAHNLKTRPDDASLKDLRELWWRPHVGALLRAMALRNQAYSATVRLVKQWLGHQLVDRADDWCEHVVYRVFQDPSPFMEPPNTPHVGLVRCLLFVSGFEWEGAPLTVDLDETLAHNPEQQHQLQLAYERAHSKGASTSRLPPLWVSSFFDPHALLLPLPTAMNCKRIIAKSKAALDVFRQNFEHPSAGLRCWAPLFTAPLSAFDLVLHLHPLPKLAAFIAKTLGRQHKKERLKTQREQFANLPASSNQDPDGSTDIHPEALSDQAMAGGLTAMLVNQLRQRFAGTAEFFYNPLLAPPPLIAVKLHPSAFELKLAGGEGERGGQSASVAFLGHVMASMGKGLVSHPQFVAK